MANFYGNLSDTKNHTISIQNKKIDSLSGLFWTANISCRHSVEAFEMINDGLNEEQEKIFNAKNASYCTNNTSTDTGPCIIKSWKGKTFH